jgi:hypothetical protein
MYAGPTKLSSGQHDTRLLGEIMIIVEVVDS